MQWPPNKAWTSASLREGFRHFVAVHYGGRGTDRWVHLVSVIDPEARLRVPWQEMKDPCLWTSGWLQLPREEANPAATVPGAPASGKDHEAASCLHPSKDFDARPWFSE